MDATKDGGGGALDVYFATGGEGGEYSPNTIPNVVIMNSTIAYNHSEVADRDGIWHENGKLLLRYSMIANNGARNCRIDAPNPAIQFSSIGSLDNDGSCAPALQADPALLPLGYYGGSTPMFALQANSPAIDAGPADVCAGMVDQRSVLRPRDGNRDGKAACDIGAYEYADRYTVAAANADGLVGYWKFDEGGGAASLDSAGNNLPASLQGGASFSANHAPLLFVAPYALQSSLGAGALVGDAPSLNPVNELTVAAWVRLNSSAGTQPIVSKLAGDQADPGYALLVRDNLLAAEAWDSVNKPHVITSSITTGTWLHVAMTYKTTGEMAAYINGRKVGTQLAPNTLAVSSAPLQMAVDGALDDVRIYNRALSAGGRGSPGRRAQLRDSRHDLGRRHARPSVRLDWRQWPGTKCGWGLASTGPRAARIAAQLLPSPTASASMAALPGARVAAISASQAHSVLCSAATSKPTIEWMPVESSRNW